MGNLEFLSGNPTPFGATLTNDGVNFAIFSRNATSVTLDIFENEDDDEPIQSFTFDNKKNKIGDIWYGFVKGLQENSLYLYRVDGVFIPTEGMRFNYNNYLLDPYAKAITNSSIFENEGLQIPPPNIDGDLFYSTHTQAKKFPKCVVVNDNTFDWQGDQPLKYKMNNIIIY